MFAKIAILGDRMLAKMVPSMTASAANCVRAPEFDYLCNSYQMAYSCIGPDSCYIACHYA